MIEYMSLYMWEGDGKVDSEGSVWDGSIVFSINLNNLKNRQKEYQDPYESSHIVSIFFFFLPFL